MRRFFRITYYLGGILLFVLIAIIGYTQTRSFKTFLRNTILQESLKVLNGELQLGVIDGNLVTGFLVHDVSVKSDTTTFFSAERIELKYDLFGFFFKRVAISHALFVKPYIHLYRTQEGIWNVARLIKPTPADTAPFAWNINIKRVELRDADVLYTDSLLLQQRQTGERELPPDSVIDYARVRLQAFSLVASMHIVDGLFAGTIRDLQFTSQTPAFSLTHASGNFLLTKSDVSARDVRLETPFSHIRLDAGLRGVDIRRVTSLEELKMKSVDLTLSADNLNTKELKQFLYPSVDFLDREIKLRLTVKGLFSDLTVEQLSIQLPHSMMQLHGQLRNLHHPGDLEMSVEAIDNFITPHDLLDCLPGLNLTDLTFLGPVKYSLTYEGKPLDFKAHVIANTEAGDIDVNGSLTIKPENPLYAGIITVQSLALGTILRDEEVSSNLNGKIHVDGTGFDPLTMTALAKVEMDSSSINGLPLQHSVFVFDIADGLLRSHAGASLGSGNYEISNQVKFFRNDSANYRITGRIRSLDLAELLKEKQYQSELSFDLTAAGAIGAEARSDTAEIHFARSVFGVETFESGVAKTIYHVQDRTKRSLQVRSTAADLDVEGSFTPASFIAAWDNSYRLVTEAVAYRFRSLDSLRSFDSLSAKKPEFQPSTIVSGVGPLDVQFHLHVKDLRPVGAFIHVPLSGTGVVDGGVIGDSADMQLTGDATLEQFGLRSEKDSVSADTASFKYFFGGICHQTMFETFSASVDMELQNFKFNSLLFNQVSSLLQVESDSSDLQCSAFIDSTARIDIEGTSHMRAGLMEFTFPELKTEVGQYVAENMDTVRFVLGHDGFYLQSLGMAHENEEAVLTGYFSPTGISDLNVSVKGFLLSNLKQVLHRGPYARVRTQFGGMVDATAIFRGSFDHPNLSVDLRAEGVRAEDSTQNKYKVLGTIESRFSYFEHMLNILVKFVGQGQDPQASPDLLLSGSLPYEFVLAREIPHRLEGEVDLTLKSTGMNLEFFDPFIPEISNLSGVMTCDMRMKGPIETPRYEGLMSIRNAGLVFDPLNIRYILNGNLVPAGDRIQLEEFTVRNDPQEPLHVGTMKVSGTFTLLGLQLERFDLLAQGDLKVMSEGKRIAGQKLYGNLFAATGPNGLLWQGDLSSSTVRGDIYVKDAALTLPPEREAELMRASVVNVTFKNDTSETIVSSSEQANRKKLKDTVRVASVAEHSSFLDGINYDVGIETQGPTQLWFVFNTQTSEVLYADLQGRLYFNRIPGMSRLTGQVDVTNRSYYNFIKKFEATGKLLFTGNELNPELDISGTYQGTHTADTTNQVAGSTSVAKDEQVLVTLQISGTRNEPKTRISLQTKTSSEKDWKKWEKGDEEANAISFIIAGQFRDELTDQQRMGLIGTNLGFALASSMLTGPLSEAARKATYGVVQSVDMLYYGGQFGQAADLRVTGQVGEAVIRAGGRVFTGDIGNTNVSVELPMSSIVGVEGLRNLILTLERRVEGIQNVDEQRRASNSARLFYRITF